MKNLLIFIVLAAMLTGCMSYTSIFKYTGIYKVGLEEVESPKNIKEQFGKTKVVNFMDQGVTKYSYEDTLIQIVWLPLSTQFSFSLTNKSDHSMKIIWDEAVYVNVNGLSQKVFHSGVKYTERNNSQPTTTIVKGAKIDDLIMPTDNVYFISGEYGGWKEHPLFINFGRTAEELSTVKSLYVGKVVKVLLPIKIEDTTNEYLFTFKIEDFVTQ
ncbi:MAG: hypothetical protein NTZ69_15385 [Bacteroidia bacterium]|nr:hypothetical protein [Bacteroidia bacterium]